MIITIAALDTCRVSEENSSVLVEVSKVEGRVGDEMLRQSIVRCV